MKKKTDTFREGLDPRMATRAFQPPPPMLGDRYCRQFLPWGGFCSDDACECDRRCKLEREGGD